MGGKDPVNILPSPGYDWEHYRKGYTELIPPSGVSVRDKMRRQVLPAKLAPTISPAKAVELEARRDASWTSDWFEVGEEVVYYPMLSQTLYEKQM